MNEIDPISTSDCVKMWISLRDEFLNDPCTSTETKEYELYKTLTLRLEEKLKSPIK
jgi:hypothetical protein